MVSYKQTVTNLSDTIFWKENWKLGELVFLATIWYVTLGMPLISLGLSFPIYKTREQNFTWFVKAPASSQINDLI